MNGKKFVIYFSLVTIVVGVIITVLMKRAYDTRPQIPIEEPVSNQEPVTNQEPTSNQAPANEQKR